MEGEYGAVSYVRMELKRSSSAMGSLAEVDPLFTTGRKQPGAVDGTTAGPRSRDQPLRARHNPPIALADLAPSDTVAPLENQRGNTHHLPHQVRHIASRPV